MADNALVIYHNPNCSKSNLALEYLSKQAIDFRVVDVLHDTLSLADLQSLQRKLGAEAKELVRHADPAFEVHKNILSGTEEELLLWLMQNPDFLHRPYVTKGEQAILARPIERLAQWITTV